MKNAAAAHTPNDSRYPVSYTHLHTASPLNGSRWLMIPVTDEAVLTDVKELIGIRAAA